jgi:hypothetical protein
LDSVEDVQVVQSWLQRFQGQSDIPNCHLEITACNPNEPRTTGATIGELFLIDKEGRQAYLPLMVADKGDRKIQTQIESSQRRLKYIKFDRYFEEEFGRTEAYRLEIRLDSTGEHIQRLDLGTYATRKKLHQPNGNESRWYNCGE